MADDLFAARYRVLFKCTGIGICHLDGDGRVTESNSALQRMFRLGPQELAGKVLADFVHPAESDELAALIRKVATGRRDRIIMECHWVRKDGRSMWSNVTVTGVAVAGHDLDRRELLALIEDTTAGKAHEATLRQRAMHDEVTQLPGRSLLHDRINHAVRSARRQGTTFSVLVLDLQRFRSVNERFGQRWGDLVLEQVGRRLQRRLRASDTVARLVDDEFAVVLAGDTQAGAIKTAARLQQALRKPYVALDGQRVALDASMGLSVFPEHGEEAELLVQRAELAMRMARGAGLDYAIFTLVTPQPRI